MDQPTDFVTVEANGSARAGAIQGIRYIFNNGGTNRKSDVNNTLFIWRSEEKGDIPPGTALIRPIPAETGKVGNEGLQGRIKGAVVGFQFHQMNFLPRWYPHHWDFGMAEFWNVGMRSPKMMQDAYIPVIPHSVMSSLEIQQSQTI